jgi:CDP-paratose 2-epimerase
MSIAIITGSGGLIGSESVRFFAGKGLEVVGIDNDMRQQFFGKEASTAWNTELLKKEVPNYCHYGNDIRDEAAMKKIFKKYSFDIALVLHTAAQPSHDWAAKDPITDFTVNANGSLLLLEMTRRYCPEAVFIFTSTNKVYGDLPNFLPLVEEDTRWELSADHPYYEFGIDESMSIDTSKHSIFGASKLAADVMTQEYGRYFGMNTGIFRGGCLTGPAHSGAPLHGFLAYLAKCAVTGENYKILGYKGKQVRDNIHSLDLVNCFWHFLQNPRQGEVYNIGGSRHSNCSMQEAIAFCEEFTGRKMNVSYVPDNRIGDHIWWISDIRKFKNHYPKWQLTYSLRDILKEIITCYSK